MHREAAILGPVVASLVLTACAPVTSPSEAEPSSAPSASVQETARASATPSVAPTPSPSPTEAPTPTCENIVTPERLAVLRADALEPTEGEVRINAGTEELTDGILCTWSPPDPRSDGWPVYGWAPLQPGQREIMEAELEAGVPHGDMFDRDEAVTYVIVEGGGPIAFRITDDAVWVAPRISHLESVTWGR